MVTLEKTKEVSLPILENITPHPSDQNIENIYKNKLGPKLFKDNYENVNIYVCNVKPTEFLEFFEELSHFPSTHPTDYLWINQAKNYFLKSFILCILFLTLVCINVL